MGNDLEPVDLHANPLERYQLVFLKQKNPTLLFVFESKTLMFLNWIGELFNQVSSATCSFSRYFKSVRRKEPDEREEHCL